MKDPKRDKKIEELSKTFFGSAIRRPEFADIDSPPPHSLMASFFNYVEEKLKKPVEKIETSDAQQWEDQREAMYDAWKREQNEKGK